MRYDSFRTLLLEALTVLMGLSLAGCEALRQADAADEQPVLAQTPANELAAAGPELLDGFEGAEHTVWAFDSADDEALSAYVSEGATQGRKCLRLTLQGKGAKGRLHLRRDVRLDLSNARALIFDITAPSEKIAAALALKTGPGGVYQEAKYLPLKAGLNRDVRFALDMKSWKNEQSRWEYTAAPVNLNDVKRLMLMLYTNGQSDGDILIDNLRVEAAEAVYSEWRPVISQTSALPRVMPQYSGVQVLAAFRASYRDIFDASDISMGALVTAPSGKILDVKGFFLGEISSARLPAPSGESAAAPLPAWGPLEAKPQNTSAPANHARGAVPVWAVRFTPQEAGTHSIQVYVRNKVGETREPARNVLVVPGPRERLMPGQRGGNVRVSRRDARYLELQDGEPFFIFGQNVCWTQDWSPYLEKIKAYGGNTCRIWLCPWGVNLENKAVPGGYDLHAAKRLDDLVRQAEATGVRLIFCFTFHGANTDSWGESAYNAANGGPCAHPEDFFTDRTARRQFQRLLAYAAARWGSSPAILSWELINEIDLAGYTSPADLRTWCAEMAGYLKAVDPHNHLVTVSVSKPSFLPDLWEDNGIDFISVHGYGTDVAALAQECLAPFQVWHKPVLLAEFGGGWRPEDDIADKQGVRLQAALWLTACAPSCGAALPWWWDTHIEPLQLYPVFAAAGRFITGQDNRGRFGEWVRKSTGTSLDISGILDSQGARLFVHRPDWIRQPETRKGPLLENPQPLVLTGIMDGPFRVEFWDAKEGKVFLAQEALAAKGVLEVILPAHAGEFGIKIDRRDIVRPGLK